MRNHGRDPCGVQTHDPEVARQTPYECEVCLYVIMFDYVAFFQFQFFIPFFHNNCKTIVGFASTHNGYVTEQINKVTQMGPEIEKTKQKKTQFI